MIRYANFIILAVMVVFLGIGSIGHCGDCSPARQCLPDQPVPPESIGSMSLPFDIPIWPTIIKTEFHILPWISLNKVSVCLPGSCRAVEFRAPCLSLKPIPFWFPWLRPLDVECKNSEVCRIP